MQDDVFKYESPLGKAIFLWSQGKNIPIDIAVRLMEDGFIVSELERRYRKN